MVGAVGWQPTGLKTGFKGGDGATDGSLGLYVAAAYRAKNWPQGLRAHSRGAGLGAIGWQPRGLRTGFKGGGPIHGELGAVGWQPTGLKTGFKGLGVVGWQPGGLRTGFKGLGAVGWQPTRLKTGFKGLGAVGCQPTGLKTGFKGLGL